MNRKYIIYHLGRYFKKKNRQKEYPDINNSSNWIFKEHEIHEQDESFKYRVHKESDFSLGDLLSIIFSINRNDLQFLDVCENESMKNIRDKEDIWSYDILKPYANIKTDENSFPDIFYNIKYNKNKDGNNAEATSGVIMFHTSYAGEYKNSTRYINIVICSSLINTKKHNHNDKDSNCAYKNLTIAYDFKDPSKALTEYSFLRETINRYNNNIEKYLTDNEWKLLETMDINIGAEFYWGKKAFIENRYLDAILYFKNVYRYMRDRWYKNGLNVSEMSLLTECAFLIGYSYNDMKQYDKAYSYLELAGRSNNLQYKYKKEFINCLVNSKNLLSIIYIDDYLQELKNIPEKKRTVDEIDFFYFLLRRKAFVLIEMEQLDDAEYILFRLLEKDPDNSVVLKELAYIQNKRKQKNKTAQESVK